MSPEGWGWSGGNPECSKVWSIVGEGVGSVWLGGPPVPPRLLAQRVFELVDTFSGPLTLYNIIISKQDVNLSAYKLL